MFLRRDCSHLPDCMVSNPEDRKFTRNVAIHVLLASALTMEAVCPFEILIRTYEMVRSSALG